MSLVMYNIEHKPSSYIGELGGEEVSFLFYFHDTSDDTYYISNECLDDVIKGLKSVGKKPPEELVKFFREELTKSNDLWLALH